jgi:hypothetical protein
LQIAAETRLDHAGTEALELAATTLRQTWQKADLACHDRVIATLAGRASGPERDTTLRVLTTLSNQFEAALDAPLMDLVDHDDLMAGRWPRVIEHVSAQDVLDNWLNGTRVHLNPEKAAQVAVWSASQYEWSVIRATTSIAKVVLATHVVVRGALGVLDEDRRVTSGPGITATSVGPRS